MNVRIRPFRPEDEPEALALESRCIQGASLALRFERPSFGARSSQYDRSSILAAVSSDDRIVGLTAWAAKAATLRGTPLRCAVHYDLRVDPAVRGHGIAQTLMGAALEEADGHAECHYALAAGQNVPVARAIERFGRPHRTWPLEYLCLPVSSAGSVRAPSSISADAARHECLSVYPAEFLFEGPSSDDRGYVTSLRTPGATASVWNGEPFLSERIVRMPWAWRLAGSVMRGVRRLPRIPAIGERIRSLFVYDVCVTDPDAATGLLRAARSVARVHGRSMLYVLLPENDPRMTLLRGAARFRFCLPYRLLATGNVTPGPDDRMNVDPRDL